MFWTGITRQSSEILIEQKKNTETEETFETIKEMVELVPYIKDDIQARNVAGVGFLLNQAWYLKKEMAKNITNDLIDNWYQIAHDAGALGGRVFDLSTQPCVTLRCLLVLRPLLRCSGATKAEWSNACWSTTVR